MSFILDALRKSETERQRDSAAEFSGVPTSSVEQRVPRWLWIVGVLLVVNLAVLIGLLFRPDTPALPAADTVPATTAQPAPRPAFESQLAEARRNVPVREEAATDEAPGPQGASPVQATIAPARPQQAPVANTAALPTIHEVRADGQVTIPDLHVDIHVYSERPEDRFVFINMTRYREGSQLSEGPLLDEITSDGVVLSYQGRTFLLPRD